MHRDREDSLNGSGDLCRSLTRRQLLKAGTASVLGARLGGLLPQQMQAESGGIGTNPRANRDVSVILLWLTGGPSHLDGFDPKPDAPSNVRGPFGARPTSVPGMRISEHLPRLARVADRFSILRSITHDEAMHERAHHYLQTGARPLPTQEFPTYGAQLAKARGARNGLPPYVTISGANTTTHENADSADSEWQRSLDFRAEPVGVRDLYGPTAFGQGCLRARRLVAAGVRWVTVTQDGWDTHKDAFPILRERLLPSLDQGLSALLTDLTQRGLLETTLVLCMGEFGRTPHINAWGGRDHWPGALSVVVAGGGTRGGQVIGETDACGREPRTRALHVENLAATLYHLLGLKDPRTSAIPIEPALESAPTDHDAVIWELC